MVEYKPPPMAGQRRSRRQFTGEFKTEAVELLLSGGQTAVEVARNLGIRVELLYRWKNEYLGNQEYAFPGTGHLADPEDEKTRKLERELAGVREERDILKKALAIFSRTPR